MELNKRSDVRNFVITNNCGTGEMPDGNHARLSKAWFLGPEEQGENGIFRRATRGRTEILILVSISED